MSRSRSLGPPAGASGVLHGASGWLLGAATADWLRTEGQEQQAMAGRLRAVSDDLMCHLEAAVSELQGLPSARDLAALLMRCDIEGYLSQEDAAELREHCTRGAALSSALSFLRSLTDTLDKLSGIHERTGKAAGALGAGLGLALAQQSAGAAAAPARRRIASFREAEQVVDAQAVAE
jgi:hypothetical protein